MEVVEGSRNRRVALVHDFLLEMRGADRVFLALADLWPQAEIFTPVYDEEGMQGLLSGRTVHTSFLQRMRPTARTFRPLLPLYPYAIESFDLRGFDLVVSSSSAWAHGVIPEEDALHVCYCHNPFRYAWNARDATLAASGPVKRMALGMVFNRWRQWDWIAAQRVDRYVANSNTTRRRVARYFNRNAAIVHPPVDLSRFQPGPVGDYCLLVSKLMPHKRIDVAIEAFNRIGKPLVVVGDGPAARRLRRLAGPTIHFEGRASDERVAALLQGCRAFVVTATEEVGIAAVEAQAAGRPVIAFNEGGARETVIEGETGTFYAPCTADALAEAVSSFDPEAIDPSACLENAERFGTERFRAEMLDAVEPGRVEVHEPRIDRRALRRSRRRLAWPPAT